ncbi:sperm-associated antigen 16 protein-like [Polymixia lowei]
MTTEPKQQETDLFYLEAVRIPADTDDDFQYEEVDLEDDWSLSEGEEDFHATLSAIQQRSGDSDTALAAPKPDARPPNVPHADQPEAVDDFLRNYLLKKGMTDTLDCFQTEWDEMVQKGLGDTQAIGVVPEVYSQNQRLDSELKNAQRERDQYEVAASSAAETLVKLQKARDFYRMQHKRVLQEKNILIENMRKLKIQCASREPAIKQISERYQTVLKQKMLVSLERDKAVAQANSLQANVHSRGMREGGQSPKQDRGGGRQMKDSDETPYLSKHSKDSEFPVGTCPTNLLAHRRDKSMDASVLTKAKADSFRLSHTIKAHSQSISCLAPHPTKPAVASASDDQLWKLWGLPEGDVIATGEGHTDWLTGVSFHPDETKLGTTGGDGSLRIWDLTLGRLALTLQGHTGATWGCSFHSCGHFVATCSMDYTVMVWDLQSERCRSTLRGHSGSVNSVEFLSSSNTLLTSSADKTLLMWDARAAICAQTLYGHSSSCNHATFTPSGQVIASCDSQGIVMMWDVRNLVAPNVVVETGPKPSNQVAFNPSGRMLAVAGDDSSVRVIDLVTNQVACTLSHDDAVQSVVFDHKGEYLLSGASDGKIYVWS